MSYVVNILTFLESLLGSFVVRLIGLVPTLAVLPIAFSPCSLQVAFERENGKCRKDTHMHSTFIRWSALVYLLSFQFQLTRCLFLCLFLSQPWRLSPLPYRAAFHWPQGLLMAVSSVSFDTLSIYFDSLSLKPTDLRRFGHPEPQQQPYWTTGHPCCRWHSQNWASNWPGKCALSLLTDMCTVTS